MVSLLTLERFVAFCCCWHCLIKCVIAAAAREKVVGWYSTGPRLREADLDITELMTNYCDTPLLVICEVQVCGWNHHYTSPIGVVMLNAMTIWNSFSARACVTPD
jgi:hypothetical protein